MHRRNHVIARQVPDAPVIDGVKGTKTVDPNAAASEASFAFDGAAGASGSSTPDVAPPLVTGFIPTITDDSLSTASPSATEKQAESSSAAHSISLTTVISACVGAFVGACLIILFSVWFYRRSVRKMEAKERRGNTTRQKENWNQIKDEEDKWQGGQGGGEMTQVDKRLSTLSRSPTEKLGVFKKSPSMRTNNTDKSEVPAFEPQTFASYHPNLALEMAGATAHHQGDGEHSQVGSWDGNHSLLASLRSDRAGSGSLSPSLTRAMSTPVTVTAADPFSHHWQSAEVVNLDGSTAATDADRQSERSVNPFFSAGEHEYIMRAKENSKGKRKDENPFLTEEEAAAPPPPSDAAIQSIIAALSVPPDSPLSATSPITTSPVESIGANQYIRPLPSPPHQP